MTMAVQSRSPVDLAMGDRVGDAYTLMILMMGLLIAMILMMGLLIAMMILMIMMVKLTYSLHGVARPLLLYGKEDAFVHATGMCSAKVLKVSGACVCTKFILRRQ